MDRDWLKIAEAAVYVGVHYDTVRKGIKAGRIPYTKVPGIGIRIRKTALDQIFAKREVPVR